MREVVPATFDEAAAALADANAAGHRVAVRGGGTKSDWAEAAAATADVLLATRALDRLVAHRHGDLTATVEAGARLADVNRALAAHGQWLALDPQQPTRATIGGIVSTNDAGPRRHRYGAPRDQIIGVEIARADGVRAKAGGIVVKNVAGYDLARLVTGSFGRLGVILSATFKLYPLTSASATVLADLPSARSARDFALAINASQLTPTAVEIQAPPLRGLVRFESTPASVDAQSAAAAKLAESAGASARVVRGDEERSEWDAHSERPWQGAGAVTKIALLPSDLDAVLAAVATAASFDVVGRAGLGVLYARVDGDPGSQRTTIDRLRRAVPSGRGSVTVLRGTSELAAADGESVVAGVRTLMASLKKAFDPNGTLT